MSWVDRRAEYEELARSQSPCVVLTTKDHWFWAVLATMLWMASAGRFRREAFLKDFATTLGPIQAYPESWDTIPEWLIIHESRHTWQCEQFGWGVPLLGWFFGRRLRTWVGLVPMGLVYGFFPFPVFGAWGRMRLELDADQASWNASLKHGWQTPSEIMARAAWMADMVSSTAYLWAWPNSWTRHKFTSCAAKAVATARHS